MTIGRIMNLVSHCCEGLTELTGDCEVDDIIHEGSVVLLPCDKMPDFGKVMASSYTQSHCIELDI